MASQHYQPEISDAMRLMLKQRLLDNVGGVYAGGVLAGAKKSKKHGKKYHPHNSVAETTHPYHPHHLEAGVLLGGKGSVKIVDGKKYILNKRGKWVLESRHNAGKKVYKERGGIH
jgi:quercetin dioxygenase-like cupin family protein